ncbi:AraC-like ligand-binding domain-containing protein [Actinoplanes derwentensis]|uniref:AraC-type DNA-binding protein n=1 Tax=Actinoplanes derwentensis TaxID=113562 RepID=A0A1H1S7G8_9ACTN|nr:helix-turn-helix domain-containing protein [Actinoplanes derwentensis]GID89690.1 AraC family transcriptional regulator [Actinoplanes derwentensis]SDS43861.1 AraC-type DNA-binding protein [Actinoplanes derwentensis]
MPQTWSTRDVPATAQFSHWRELICQAFLALTPESDLRDGFAGSVTQWPLGALSIARIVSQRQRVDRTERDLAAGSPPGYYANLQLAGVSTMRQSGRVTTLRPGDVAVVDTTEPFTFEFGGDFRQLSFFIPGPLLRAQVTGRIATATRIPTTAGAGAALRHLLTALPTGTPRLAPHAAGLLAVALSESPAVSARRAPHSHARAVADIEEHLTDDDLSPSATARRLEISVRSVHALFAGRELTYSATVRRLRLERAARDLCDPARAHLRVADVAADAGFADTAGFHRAFRRQFGRTPAQLRRG